MERALYHCAARSGANQTATCHLPKGPSSEKVLGDALYGCPANAKSAMQSPSV